MEFVQSPVKILMDNLDSEITTSQFMLDINIVSDLATITSYFLLIDICKYLSTVDKWNCFSSIHFDFSRLKGNVFTWVKMQFCVCGSLWKLPGWHKTVTNQDMVEFVFSFRKYLVVYLYERRMRYFLNVCIILLPKKLWDPQVDKKFGWNWNG